MTARYWIGVASREHVKAAETGGFCQFCHGREAVVRKLSAGDGVVYYSPRERMSEGAHIRSFTAMGRVLPGTAYHAAGRSLPACAPSSARRDERSRRSQANVRGSFGTLKPGTAECVRTGDFPARPRPSKFAARCE